MFPDNSGFSVAPETHLGEHEALDLLLGLLPADREASHLSHMRRCPECEARFSRLAAGAENLAATRLLRCDASGELSLERRGTAADERSAVRARRPDSRGSRIRRISISGLRGYAAGAIAAAAIVVLLMLPQAINRNSLPLFPLPPYGSELQVRDAGTVPGAEFTEGLAAYEAGDTGRAVELLQGLPADELDELDSLIRTLYLGSALALEGRHEEAATMLDGAPLSLLPGEWGAEAQWTLFVSLSESGQTARARDLLADLGKRDGEIGERAREAARRSGE